MEIPNSLLNVCWRIIFQHFSTGFEEVLDNEKQLFSFLKDKQDLRYFREFSKKVNASVTKQRVIMNNECHMFIIWISSNHFKILLLIILTHFPLHRCHYRGFVTVWRTCDERGECHMTHVTQCHVMSWWMLGGTPLRIYRLSRRRVISDSHDPGNCLWTVSDDAERQRTHHKSQIEF